VAVINRKIVLGFGTDVGSKTSHTAIMARSLQLPAIVGLKVASVNIKSGAHILLDGYNGSVVINPSDQTLFEYGRLVRQQASIEEKLRAIQSLEAITLDGQKITLSANIEQSGDIEAVKEFGAEGVGLFRTEYLFINRETLPTEDEQCEAYRKVAAALKPAPVIIRTLDLGGDKFLAHLQLPLEMNPFLGWRAIRFCLEEREVFRAQLRAILRASAEGNVKIMYPMISSHNELDQANAFVEQYKNELRAEKIPFDEKIEIGAMNSLGGGVGGHAGQAGEVFQPGHQRSHPVRAGGGPFERPHRASLRADPSGGAAVDQMDDRRRRASRSLVRSVRGDGGRSGLDAAVAGVGREGVEHGPAVAAARQIPHPPAENGRRAGTGQLCLELRIGP